VHGDDLEGAVAIAAAPFARELDRALVRLGAAVAQEHLVETGRLGQERGERRHRLVVVRGTAVDQAAGLRLQGVEHDAWRMPERVHGPSLDEVQVAFSVTIPEP
jgi:hypothetical protein